MKKIIVLLGIVVSSLSFASVEASDVSITRAEKDKFKTKFFDEMKTKKEKENEDILVVDTINGYDELDSFDYEGISISKKAVITSLMEKDDKEIEDVFKKLKKSKNTQKKEKLDKLEKKFKEKKVKYSDVSEEFDDLEIYDTDADVL